MSAHGFKTLFMAASVAGAALGCYLVSLNVASERAKLERVEGKIVLAQREIRLLQTEIGTRGRLAQLERWNAGFIRLSAPTADQFLEGGFQLASMVRPAPSTTIEAPIVLASVSADQGVARQGSTSDSAEANPGAATRARAPSVQDMMHSVSYQRPPVSARPTAIASARPAKPTPAKSIAATDDNVAAIDALAPLPAPKAAKATQGGGGSTTASLSAKTRETGTPR